MVILLQEMLLVMTVVLVVALGLVMRVDRMAQVAMVHQTKVLVAVTLTVARTIPAVVVAEQRRLEVHLLEQRLRVALVALDYRSILITIVIIGQVVVVVLGIKLRLLVLAESAVVAEERLTPPALERVVVLQKILAALEQLAMVRLVAQVARTQAEGLAVDVLYKEHPAMGEVE